MGNVNGAQAVAPANNSGPLPCMAGWRAEEGGGRLGVEGSHRKQGPSGGAHRDAPGTVSVCRGCRKMGKDQQKVMLFSDFGALAGRTEAKSVAAEAALCVVVSSSPLLLVGGRYLSSSSSR